MTHLNLRNCFRAFGLITIPALLFIATTTPGEAKGLKSKLKKTFSGKKEKNTPKVGVVKPDDSTTSTSTAGERQVLLVSIPKHAAEIVEGSTIAFIEFNHIEHELPKQYRDRTTVEIKEQDFGPLRHDIYTRIEEEGYDSDVCARQVASALAQHLADLNQFKVVTREHLATVLDEQSFANSGSVDSATAVRLGELIGADILIYGQVQLCVSSSKDYEILAKLALETGTGVGGDKGGWLSNMFNAFKSFAPEKLRSFVLAQIQLISAETGKRVFTTSLAGEFEDKKSALSYDVSHRELIYRAADDLANGFIDKFLARREPLYIPLYADTAWEFGKGVDLIQLGDCARAEQHFRDVYGQHRWSMDEMGIAKLMYNHGISLMCTNRSEEALDRLWASLRLSNESRTFEAIAFTNDILDRGRYIIHEDDPIIRNVKDAMYPMSSATVGTSP